MRAQQEFAAASVAATTAAANATAAAASTAGNGGTPIEVANAAAAAAVAATAAADAAYNVEREARAVAAAAAAPLTDQSLDALLLPTELTSAPLVALADNPRAMFHHYGYALLPATPLSTAFAASLDKWYTKQAKGSLFAPEEQIVIAGDVKQFDMMKLLGEWNDKFNVDRVAVSDEMMKDVGLSRKKRPYAVAPKLLVASPGKGEQMPHMDSFGAWTKRHIISTLVIVSEEEVDSTALPRFPQSLYTFDSPTPEIDDLSAYRAYHDEKAWYHTVKVRRGDRLIFRHSVPHYGTTNPLARQPRIVFFQIRSDVDDEDQDNAQHYPWHLAEAEHGFDSLEYAQSLVRYAAFRPIDRFEAKSDRVEAISVLTKYGLIREMFPNKKDEEAILKAPLTEADMEAEIAALEAQLNKDELMELPYYVQRNKQPTRDASATTPGQRLRNLRQRIEDAKDAVKHKQMKAAKVVEAAAAAATSAAAAASSSSAAAAVERR